MADRRLFKLPLDPERIEAVRTYFADLEGRRETFKRGLALENMNAETAWLDEAELALYYLHEEHAEYPADVDESDMDEQLRELSAEHHEFFQTVITPDHEHPEEVIEFERLFSASARDRIE